MIPSAAAVSVRRAALGSSAVGAGLDRPGVVAEELLRDLLGELVAGLDLLAARVLDVGVEDVPAADRDGRVAAGAVDVLGLLAGHAAEPLVLGGVAGAAHPERRRPVR